MSDKKDTKTEVVGVVKGTFELRDKDGNLKVAGTVEDKGKREPSK